jgi:hypothetical protein
MIIIRHNVKNLRRHIRNLKNNMNRLRSIAKIYNILLVRNQEKLLMRKLILKGKRDIKIR